MNKTPLLSLLLNLSYFVRLIFWEARSELLPEISVSSIYAFVFSSGLWEWMTNDTEGSTSRSLKLWQRYDLSLWLTCAISLHTYSNSWLNPSLFSRHFFHQCAFAFSLFWSIFQDKDLLFIQRSHLNGTRECGKGMDINLIWQCIRLKAAWGVSSRNGCAQKMHQHKSFLLSGSADKPQAPHQINSELALTKIYSFVSVEFHVCIAVILGNCHRKTSSAVLTGRQQVNIYCCFCWEVYQRF